MEERKVCGGGGPINSSAEAAPVVTFDCGEELAVSVESCPELATSTDFLMALDDKMPFLQMLQTLCSSNMKNSSVKAEIQVSELEANSSLPKLHLPMKSEDKGVTQVSQDGIFEENGVANTFGECRNDLGLVSDTDQFNSKPLLSCRKMRKPKRAKVVVENKDTENQRMTHIAVERNRRRLMSEYLIILRSLLPHNYAPKGDQASIVGGAIDYLKNLEHHLQCLESRKRQRNMAEIMSPETSHIASTSASCSSDILEEDCRKKPDVNIMLVQTHANLRIQCENMTLSKLIKFLGALEEMGLTILHLNVNSIHNSSFYSLSLKVEDECKIRSAEEISGSVEKILKSLNICNRSRSSVRHQNQDDARNVKDEQ